jgi:predicted glycosyltransferase
VAPTGGSDDKPSHLPIGDGAIVAIRRQVLLALMGSYRPHALYVDNFALGARKELAPTLAMLRRTPTRTILGLRDIIDAPEAIQERWPRDGVLDALRDLYDEVLVFGAPEVFDLAEEYALDGPLRDKLRYCGYVAREAAPASEARMAELGLGRPRWWSRWRGRGTARRWCADSSRPRRPARAVGAGGHGAPDGSARPGGARGSGRRERRRVTLRDFVPGPAALMAAADLVVSMGGYNTVAEILRNRCRR